MINPMSMDMPNTILMSASMPTWGEHSLFFQVNDISLGFTGLSSSQKNSIQDRYSGFVQQQDQVADRSKLSCRVYRMPQAPEVPFSDLTRDGQYAPLQSRQSDAIGMTGSDFRACIPLQESSLTGSLGVVNEVELTYPSVIENVMRVFTAYKAVESGGIILHSAGLVFGGKAYVFVGRSNVGKTTLTRKAHQFGAKVLSDDINMVLPSSNKNGYAAHAVPFTGEFGRTLEHVGGHESYPLAALILLKQGKSLKVDTVEPSDAVAKLLVGSPFVNMDEKQAPLLFDAVSTLAKKVPVMCLQSTREESVENIMQQIKNRISNA